MESFARGGPTPEFSERKKRLAVSSLAQRARGFPLCHKDERRGPSLKEKESVMTLKEGGQTVAPLPQPKSGPITYLSATKAVLKGEGNAVEGGGKGMGAALRQRHQ